jgi:poly(beta-D-mannuronate) lyase
MLCRAVEAEIKHDEKAEMLKNMRSIWRLSLAALVLAALASNASAREISVPSLDGLRRALDAAKPGDRIILADGGYKADSPIPISAVGTPDEPIIIAAEHVGEVELTGAAGFRLEEPAAYVVLQGFVFTHEAGELQLGEGVHHCRITRNVFELAIPDHGRARYLSVLGDDNEIDHNEFRNKSTEGQMLHVQGPGRRAMAERIWIHHNHFHDFRPSRRNNSSALHVGHSERSMTSAWTVVEHNLFERTQGENEGAICNKASDNVYRFNTLGEQSSELSLRHGKRCLVYGNYFLGGNGLRFFSHDHRIYSNVFTNCRPAITIGNGGATIPPGPLTSHERPERVHIVHNTLVNNRENIRMQGRRRGLGATDIVIANNIIIGGRKAANLDGPMEGAQWADNILWDNDGGPGGIPASGYGEIDPQLASSPAAFYKLLPSSPAAAAARNDFPFVTTDVEGQPCGDKLIAGADQLSEEPATPPLTPTAVGPNAAESERPWIAAPNLNVPWIEKPKDVNAEP